MHLVLVFSGSFKAPCADGPPEESLLKEESVEFDAFVVQYYNPVFRAWITRVGECFLDISLIRSFRLSRLEQF